MMGNAEILESYTGINDQILRHYGSDFLSAPAIATFAQGAMVTAAMYYLSHKFLPTRATEFFTNYYRIIRSGVTLAALGVQEVFQAVDRQGRFDIKDMVAYGLGLTVINHGYDLFRMARDGLKSITAKTPDKPDVLAIINYSSPTV